MRVNRRLFVATAGGLAACGLTGESLSACEGVSSADVSHPDQRRRRIIVNRDAGLPTQWDIGRDDYVKRNFADLVGDGCQVDSVFWCFDEGTTAGYESKVRELQRNWESGQTSPGLIKAIAEGNDPPKVVIEECRKRKLEVFYSFRINGHEDSYLPAEVPQFKKDHPEYTLKGHVPDEVWSCLNFAIPAVRQQRIAVIQEVLEKYDFDGIEIDWLRSPYYFRQHQEYRLRYLLTDMMRAFRWMVDERAKQIGRRLWLAVRVDETLESCLLDGLDVEVWAREGLMDILALGSGVTYCDVPGFRTITRDTEIDIYPCLYRYGPFYKEYEPLIVRGIASNYWHNGADGIYTFNYGSERPIGAFTEIGSVETLAGLDKMFVAYIGQPDAPIPYYPHNWMFTPLPAELWATRERTPLTVPLIIGDDFSAQGPSRKLADLRLRVVLANAAANDEIVVGLNGHELDDAVVESGAPDDSKIQFAGVSLTFTVKTAMCRVGRNEVTVMLKKRESDSSTPVVVHAVDMLMRYST